MKMKLEANKELFDQWKVLGQKVTALGNLIQNDGAILDSEEVNNWMVDSIAVSTEVKLLAMETYAWMAQHHTPVL